MNQRPQTANLPHTPVMLEEMLYYLEPKEGEVYLDATFGAGGYSKAILSSCNCKVIALDQDPNTLLYANELTNEYRERFHFLNINFADYAYASKNQKFDGIVMDLGVSSMQLDQSERGFSFMNEGPLDMRMNAQGLSAADFINTASEEEIANIIYKYGDELASRKIAKAIVLERSHSPISTTSKLAEIVRSVVKIRGKIDSATKTFQAIRIYVNKELEKLEEFLGKVETILNPQGRLVIVSFHSLEDRIVKYFIKEHSIKKIARSKYAKTPQIIEDGKWIRILTGKAIAPSSVEQKRNPRSRSAKLRAIIKEVDNDN